MARRRRGTDPDVAWLAGILRRNPSPPSASGALRELAARHGRDHVHRLLAIEYEKADGTRWRHEAGDRGDGFEPERRPTYLVVDDGQRPRVAGPMRWQDGRGLVG